MTRQAFDELDLIRQGPIFAGMIDPSALDELLSHDLVELFYEGAIGFMGFAKVRIKQP